MKDRATEKLPFPGITARAQPSTSEETVSKYTLQRAGRGKASGEGGAGVSVGEKTRCWLHSRPAGLRLRCAEAHGPDGLGQWGLPWGLA